MNFKDFVFKKNVFYTFRFVFQYISDEGVKTGVSHLTCLEDELKQRYDLMMKDDSIISAIAEYLGEYSCEFAGLVFELKKKEVSNCEEICN